MRTRVLRPHGRAIIESLLEPDRVDGHEIDQVLLVVRMDFRCSPRANCASDAYTAGSVTGSPINSMSASPEP
jgi:hypothetical protein